MIRIAKFWNQNESRISLFNSEKQKEIEQEFLYGVSEPVPLYFVNNGNRLISSTPCGKMVFIGDDFSSLADEEILYRNLNLLHFKSYCMTVGKDYRDKTYWRYISVGNAVSAASYLSSISNISIDEANKMSINDSPIAGIVVVYSNKYTESDATNKLIIDDLKLKIVKLNNHINSITDNLAELESENYYLKNDISNVNSMHKELKSIKLQLKKLQEENYRLRNSSNSQQSTTIDPWKIIKCSKTDDEKKVISHINAALKKYHPDKYNEAGDEIQKLSNAITLELIELRKSFVN